MNTNEHIRELKAKPNIARFFVQNPHVSWAMLVVVFLWGLFGYQQMPKSKDPDIPVRVAMVATPWPGHDAVEIEQLITRVVEEKIAESEFLKQAGAQSFSIKSLTLPGISLIQVQLAAGVNRDVAFNEIARQLNAINKQLPDGAGPISVNSSFGDTAAIMFSVASPKAGDVEIALRSQDIANAIKQSRSSRSNTSGRAAIIVAAPLAADPAALGKGFRLFRNWLQQAGLADNFEVLQGTGFIGLDFGTNANDSELLAATEEFLSQRLGSNRFHSDAWPPVIVRDVATTETSLRKGAGDKYSYRQLDEFTEVLSSNLKTIPQVSRVLRSGIIDERISLSYSQEELVAYGVVPARIKQVIKDRNTTVPGGVLPVEGMQLLLSPSGGFNSLEDIENLIITQATDGTPVYLRNLLEVSRGYQQPPRLLNYLVNRDSSRDWQRNRSVTLALYMHKGEQIGMLGENVQKRLKQVQQLLPEDLIITRVSDQPAQVDENISLFMRALLEAVFLVVLVALIGFWDWRLALLMMISIPITLAMTFGTMYVLGIDVQQVSIAALIIALGLLVDDPVVAGDAIKRELAEGRTRELSAWLGPTLLATAIFFATATNVIAYLPFLMLSGNQGDFLYSLPIVISTALISSRIVSMTFVPFLGSLLLKPETGGSMSLQERRKSGFTGVYYRLAGLAIDHRKAVLLVAVVLLVAGLSVKSQLKNTFFPDDVQYISTIDVWLKNSANINATNQVAEQVERLVREELTAYAKEQALDEGILELINTTIGGGAPRFWFTVTPEQRQSNYAQLIVRLNDKELTPILVPRLQAMLSRKVAGADIDVKQLQTTPVNYPVAIRLASREQIGNDIGSSGAEIEKLRAYARELTTILKQSPAARTVRNDWGDTSLVVKLDIDNDRANLAGITNEDIAVSTSAAINGVQVGTFRSGHRQIPIITQLQLGQRARISDLDSLYVYSVNGENKVPLAQVSSKSLSLETERIRRLDQFRTITVFSYPHDGFLAADIIGDVKAQIDTFASKLPNGYLLQISGAEANTQHGFSQLIVILAISTLGIFMALVVQFRNLVKPILVFATVPFGVVGSLLALWIMGEPFGFMAFLGIVSLIGVIVSHIILLFDFIEERHKAGDPFREALLDAGIMRLRPVLITVAATALALFPLAIEGGPLWRGLAYAQIGGLFVAVFATLILVPTLYAMTVLDLKAIKWEETTAATSP